MRPCGRRRSTISSGGARERGEGRLYGIGYAVVVEPSQSNMGYISTLKTGIERERSGQKDGAIAAATINMDPLGSISVIADSVPQGQGHQTALAQIVADQLGVRFEDVVVNLETERKRTAGRSPPATTPAASRRRPSATHWRRARLREKLARIAGIAQRAGGQDRLRRRRGLRARQSGKLAEPSSRSRSGALVAGRAARRHGAGITRERHMECPGTDPDHRE